MRKAKRKNAERKQPLQSRSSRLVEALNQATARILGDTDFIKTTTNRIAEVAGVSIGSLYQYFPNKESLVRSVLERAVEKNSVAVIEIFEKCPPGTFDGRVTYVVDRIVDHFVKERGFFTNLFVEAGRLNAVKIIVNARNRMIPILKKFLTSELNNQSDSEMESHAFVLIHATMGTIQMVSLDLEASPEITLVKSNLKHLILSYCLRLNRTT